MTDPIETDPRLIEDPLWVALDNLVYRLKSHLGKVLWQYRWEHPDGLDGPTIANLCEAAGFGPVMGWGGEEQRLTFYHPVHPRPVVLDLNPVTAFHSPSGREKTDQAVAYISAWRDARGRELRQEPAESPKGRRGRKSNPKRDAEIAKEYREATNADASITQTSYAEKIGMTRQTLHALLKRAGSVKTNGG